MDAMELARRQAAALHDVLVADGADPWRPFELARAAADHLGFHVESTAPGAAALHGSRATVIPQEGMILHENAGTPFDQAFLIGHEVGHVALGDATLDAGACEFDAARRSEAAPVGIDRVVDYSAHQRREVQMDLFSRELLLPRARARKLHVDDGLSASDIALRLGAPFNVVAQQLFDALLLPEITESPELKPAPPLNDMQRDAAEHEGSPFLLEAGPGTGKTQTLTGRVEKLLERRVEPRRILVLTFSNKAAGEMVERISRNDAEAATSMWMGTFHAFGLELVRQFHEELGLPKDPRLLDRVEAAELLEREFPRLGLEHYRNLYDPTRNIIELLSAISRAKDEVADVDHYRDCATAMLEVAGSDAEKIIAAEKALEAATVYEAYERIKHEAGAVDFGDLVMLPVKLLESNDDVRAAVQQRYDHVLVDEFQDVNRASVRLLQAVTGGGAELWAVGDAKQSIYRFRGASAYNVARFGKEDFPGGKRARLEINYRSVEEVVDAFTQFAAGMAVASGDASLQSYRGPCGVMPELRTVEKNSVQSAAVADAIMEFHGQGVKYRDQAVLCTGNERLTKIARELERMDVPVLFLGSLFERPEIKDLISLISLLVEPRAMGLVRTATMPDFAMSMADVMSALENYRLDERAETGLPSAPEGISPEGKAAFAALAAAFDGFDETTSPWTLLARLLLDRTRIAARIASSDRVSERAQGIAIWQFMNFAAAQPMGQGLPIRRILDRIRRLVRLSEDRDLRQMPAAAQGLDAVRLMTVHGAKGLEFEAVHLPGMNQGTLPRYAQTPTCPPPDGLIEGADADGMTAFFEGHDQEQECLFYVAMSRARDRLIMSAARLTEANARRNLSPFIERLGVTVRRRDVVPGRELPSDPDSLPIELALDGPLRFSQYQVALYESCPRRFFYTHMMRVGGKRVATPFMHMHEAVFDVVNGIVAGTMPSDSQGIRVAVEQACRDAGIEDDGQLQDYVSLATGLVEFFRQSREGMDVLEPVELVLNVDGHEIVFRPDDILVDGEGVTHVRRMRTGHARSTDTKDLGASALKLAVAAEMAGAVPELIHLSDGTVTPLTPSGRGDGGRAKLGKTLAAIAEGDFPTKVSAQTCPSCPAFFICGPVPFGPFEKSS